MVINPPLILVSALFFLALILRIRRGRLASVVVKRILMAALVLPPFLAAIPTFAGATFKHSHARPSLEHHSMLCQQMFTQFYDATRLDGSVSAGIIANGLAWAIVLAGVVLVSRLFWATLQLERGIAPYLAPPSPKLVKVLENAALRLPQFRAEQFYECAIPAAYSSVFGLWRVRCVLSQEFVLAATEQELVAVIAHESTHLRARDAWATLLVGALNCLFFALRPVRLLGRWWREAAELACDDAAVSTTKDPRAMASAILRVSGVEVSQKGIRRSLPATTLAFADSAACSPAARVERLIAQAQGAMLPVAAERPLRTGVTWGVTLMLAGLGIAMLVSPAAMCYAHCTMESVARLLP
jgi:beta-lactamase regulating signal transducer with metallopeptidase domain